MIIRFALPMLAILFLTACSTTKPEEQEKNDRRLFISIRYPSTARMKYALEHGANPNATDKYQVPALTRAVAAGKAEHVKLLLERGAKIDAADADGETPLFAAAALPGTDMLKLLLKHGANVNCKGKDGKTPLMEAARLGNRENVEILIRNGADVLARDSRKASAASYAAEADRNAIGIIEILKTKGLDSDIRSTDPFVSPFLRAVMFNQTATAIYLLQQMPELDSGEDMQLIGRLAAYHTIFHNDMTLLKAMVERKLPLNYEEPLPYRAAKLLKVDGIYKLSARNEMVERNYTPLMYACVYGHPLMVEYLVDSGANPLIENTEGQIAEAYASDQATLQMIRRKTSEWRNRYLNQKINPPSFYIKKDNSVRRTPLF